MMEGKLMEGKPVMLTDVDGKKTEALLVECPSCKSELFKLFLLKPGTELQVQCSSCGQFQSLIRPAVIH